MNKDELKQKGEHLKEKIKEGFGEEKKEADAFIDRTREHGRDASDEVKQDTPVEDEDV